MIYRDCVSLKKLAWLGLFWATSVTHLFADTNVSKYARRLICVNEMLDAYGIQVPSEWNDCVRSTHEKHFDTTPSALDYVQKFEKWTISDYGNPPEVFHENARYVLKADYVAFPFEVWRFSTSNTVTPDWIETVKAMGDKQRILLPGTHYISVIFSADSKYLAVFGRTSHDDLYVQVISTSDGWSHLFACFPRFEE